MTCPFSVIHTLNKPSSPGFMESLPTRHTGKQEPTPWQTAIYLLKSLWVLDFSEAPTLTGCHKSFHCQVPPPALTAVPLRSLIFMHTWMSGECTHLAHFQMSKLHLKPLAPGDLSVIQLCFSPLLPWLPFKTSSFIHRSGVWVRSSKLHVDLGKLSGHWSWNGDQ